MRDKYFGADYTAYRDGRDDNAEVLAIYAGEVSRRNPDGSTSAFLRFPALVVSEYTANAKWFAETVAEVLEENAHRFFSSAADAKSQIEEPRSGDTDGAEQRTPA